MMQSSRLRYEPLSPLHLDSFHALVQDDHIRRYLMDGELFPREWSADRIKDSAELMAGRGVLEKLGFQHTATGAGAFGSLFTYTLRG